MQYVERVFFTEPVSETLQKHVNVSIKQILSVLDATIPEGEERRRLKKVILDSINDYHRAACDMCTKIQDHIERSNG